MRFFTVCAVETSGSLVVESPHGMGQATTLVPTVRLRNDSVDDMTVFDTGQALIEPEVPIRQALVIDAHKAKNRGVQIGHVAAVFLGAEAQFIRRSDRLAAANARAGEPHRE